MRGSPTMSSLSLVAAADDALYRAKSDSRDQVEADTL